MATAKKVSGSRPPSHDLVVVDTDDITYRYSHVGTAPDGATVHICDGVVATHPDGTPILAFGLVFDENGRPLLRQDGPGLPAKIGVRYQNTASFMATDEYQLIS